MAQGVELIESLVLLSGLPQAWAQQEIKGLLDARGLDIERVSLSELREIMVDLVQVVLVQAKEFDQAQGLASLFPDEPAEGA